MGCRGKTLCNSRMYISLGRRWSKAPQWLDFIDGFRGSSKQLGSSPSEKKVGALSGTKKLDNVVYLGLGFFGFADKKCSDTLWVVTL
mmetsp:Transcript_20955/g.42554  ORF Transcript_20955/g.42554 Transcript_20955/m.42554 type:complete len:87 (-) Transcript_20955:336-596(-)